MADLGKAEIVDLSHVIEDGMTTYKGLPGPHICDFWTREDSAGKYDDGSTFQIGRIDMVANTGTYVDSPFHRYADGKDLAELPLGSLVALPGVVVRRPHENGLATAPPISSASTCEGKRFSYTPAETATGEPTPTPPIIPFSPLRLRNGWSSKGPRWSGSTATISTTPAAEAGRFTRLCSLPTFRSASI